MPDMYLGGLVRPPDPRELKYALTRTLPPRAVNLSEPRLLSRWQGRDVRVPIMDQGPMGACASFSACAAVRMAGNIAGRPDVVVLAPGPLYEWVRRFRDWYPEDTGSYLADNLDRLMGGGPAVVEPYIADAAYDYSEAAWDQRETRDYIASHRPFYPSDEGGSMAFLDNLWSSLDAGLPVQLGSYWPAAWFNPVGGVVDGDTAFSPNDGGHAYVAWGVSPGYIHCANSWSPAWSADAPSLGWDMRPGDFAIPWKVIERGILFEARAVSFEPVPEPEPQPADCPATVANYLAGKIRQWDRSTVKRSAAREIQNDLRILLS